MRKINPLHRWHLTPEERIQIRQAHLEGLRNVDICRKLKLNRNTVHKALVDMSLPITRRPPLPRQEEALSLLRKGWGPRRVATELGLSKRGMIAFALQHGFGRRRKVLSAAKAMLVTEDILARTGSAAAIAKRHGASYKKVLELAHSLLQCEKFLPSWRSPLTSYFPSRGPSPLKKEVPDMKPADNEARFLQTVHDIAACLHADLSADPEVFSALCLEIFLHYTRKHAPSSLTADQWQQLRQYFDAHVRQAVSTLNTAHSGWTN